MFTLKREGKGNTTNEMTIKTSMQRFSNPPISRK